MYKTPYLAVIYRTRLESHMDVITRWTLSFHKCSVQTAAAQTDIMSLASKSSESLGMIMMRWNRKEMALHLMIRSSRLRLPSRLPGASRWCQWLPIGRRWTAYWIQKRCSTTSLDIPEEEGCQLTSCKMDSLGSIGSNKRCPIKHRELSCWFMTLVYE